MKNTMEASRKFNDCYFYYHSTCTKGDNCMFRHEPSALGSETICTAWQQGKCPDKCCKLRHMEVRKNRKEILCFWENKLGGCRKRHCPFMHKNLDTHTNGITPNQPAPPPKTVSVEQPQTDGVANTVKQELLLLEKIQAETAAYYSLDDLPPLNAKKRRTVQTNLGTNYKRVTFDGIAGTKPPMQHRTSFDFKKNQIVVHSKPSTLNLSRKRKLSAHETITTSGNKVLKVVTSKSIVYKNLDRNPLSNQSKDNDRKQTLSEQSDYEIQKDELVDNCFEFKKIKIAEQTDKSQPKLNVKRLSDSNKNTDESKYDNIDINKTHDSDSKVQIVGVELNGMNSVDCKNDVMPDVVAGCH